MALPAGPEVDEAEDLVGLVALAGIGVGITEGHAVGDLGEDSENAGVVPAPLGLVMRLDLRTLAEIQRRVEIEVEGMAQIEVVAGQLVVPAGEKVRDLLGGCVPSART